MANTSGSRPTIYLNSSNDNVFPREEKLPYNINAKHGGATAILLHNYQGETTSRTQVNLVQSGFDSNEFNTKLVVTSGVGIPTGKGNGNDPSGIRTDLQTDEDGNLTPKVRNGALNAMLFSNQCMFTHGGRFLQKDSTAEGIVDLTFQELGYPPETTAMRKIAFLVACSALKKRDAPTACCYLVEVVQVNGESILDAVPGGKCGQNEMANLWKFKTAGGKGLRIEGPPESHFVFICNREYAEDVGPEGRSFGKVFFTQTYNGEHSTTLLPKIATHYGRSMFLLCSYSCPETKLVTSALYLVAPMDRVGVYYIAKSTDDTSLSNPALWLVAKKIGKLSVRLKPELTGPCRYAFISSAPEDLAEIEKRCLQSGCIATGAEKPLQSNMSVNDGILNILVDRRVDIQVGLGSDVELYTVKESELSEDSGRFTYQKDISDVINGSSGIKLIKALVALKNRENKPVLVELNGSPCRLVTQKKGVHLAVNFGGPAYENVDGVVFDDGRSALLSLCPSPDVYFHGCHIDETTNFPGIVANTEDGPLYTTFVANRPGCSDRLYFRIPIGSGQYTVTFFTLSSGLAAASSVVINEKDVTAQIQEQLQQGEDVIPECTARSASVPLHVSGESVDISIKSNGCVKLSAILIHDEQLEGVKTKETRGVISADKKQEIGDDLSPLDRHFTDYDLKFLGWSGDLLRMNRVKAAECLSESGQWEGTYGGDCVETGRRLMNDEGALEYNLVLKDHGSEICLDGVPPIEFSESFRSLDSSGASYKVSITLEKMDGSIVQQKDIEGKLDRSERWTKLNLSVDKYGTGAGRVKLRTEVSGKGIEISAPSLRIKIRGPNRTGLKDGNVDVKAVKDTKKLVSMIRQVVQKFGGKLLEDNAKDDTSTNSIVQREVPAPLEQKPGEKPAAAQSYKKGANPKKRREIRVFVSSTFLDFAAEREILIKKAFGELKKMCLDRGVFFSYVDLRWGITSDQSNDGKTISICLREVDRCRPYFFCLLGDRFGWSQEEGQVDTLLNKSYDYAIKNFSHLKWIDDYRFKCSVTQLEVYHAALRDLKNASDNTFFYLRKPKSKEELLKEERHESEWRIDQQKKFRQTVEESGLPVRHYAKAEEGAALIREDLERCINREFPPESKLTPLQQEREAHLSFAEVRRRVYIGRSEYFTRINAYFAGDPKMPLVILGESGSGKSALVANWCGRFEDDNPGDFLFMHFIGSSADSASHLRLLRRLFEELKQHFILDMSIPTSDKALVQDLPKWLGVAGSFGKRVLLVLDALNQLDSGAVGQGDELELKWLPRELPSNVQMLLSTLPGKALDAVKAAGWPVFHVQPLNPDEKGEIITCYMELYSKSLNAEQTALIVDAPQTSNALYLKALLEEVRIYGDFFQLTGAIKSYLEAQDPGQLFVKVLERLESDFESGEYGRKSLVRDTTCAIWCCSRGMSEQELLTFLKVPSRVWSPFYLSLEENLVNRNGIVNFFHDHLRQAVERKYVSTVMEKRKAFVKLADFFEAQDINERYVEELPSLLMEINDLDRLKALVMTPHAFQLLMKTSEGIVKLIQAWRMLGGFEQAGQAYLQFVNHSDVFKALPEKEPLLSSLTNFFMELGVLKIARQLNERLLSTLERLHAKHDTCHVIHHVRHESSVRSRHPDVIENLLELGSVCHKLADFSASVQYFQDALSRLSKPSSVEQRVQMIKALSGLGQVYTVTSRPLEAHRFFLKAKEICSHVLPTSHHYVATLNGLIGEVLQKQGRAMEALRYHASDIVATQRSGGLGKPRVAAILNNIGLALMDLDSSEGDPFPFFVQALAILIDAYGYQHVDVASVRVNLGAYFFNAKLYKHSLMQYKRAQEISKVYLGALHPKSVQCKDGLRALRPFTLSS